MKTKSIIILLITLVFAVGCDSFLYPIVKPSISLVYYDRKNEMCIVEIKNNSTSGSIRYTIDGSSLSDNNMGSYYSPSTYKYNGVSYSGIRVKIGTTVNAAIMDESKIKSRSTSLSLDKTSIPKSQTPKVQAVYHASSTSDYIVCFQTLSNSDIYYTVDGSTPTDSSTKYEPVEIMDQSGSRRTGILVPEGTVLKAFSLAPNKQDSEVITYTAGIISDSTGPVITDHGLLHGNEQYHIVEISIDGPYVIRWTDDNSSVSLNSERYSPRYYLGADEKQYKGILVKKYNTVKAAGFDQNGSMTNTTEKMI